ARASRERRFDSHRRRLGGSREHGAHRRPARARRGRQHRARGRSRAPVRVPGARIPPAARRGGGIGAPVRSHPADRSGSGRRPAPERSLRDDRALGALAGARTAGRGGTGVMTLVSGARSVRAPRGTTISCKGWAQEAALRMLMNNPDPEVAERPDELVVYGGTGRAARSWEAFEHIVSALRALENDETLLVQSGKP